LKKKNLFYKKLMQVDEFASYLDERLENSNTPFPELLQTKMQEQVSSRRPSLSENDSIENIQWIARSGPRPWRQQRSLFITNPSRVVVKKNVKELLLINNEEEEEQIEMDGCVRSDSKITVDFENHPLDDKDDDEEEISHSPKSKHSFFLDIPEQLDYSSAIRRKRSSSMDFGMLPRSNSYLSFISLKLHNDTSGSVYYDPCVQAAKNFKTSYCRIKSFLKRSTTTNDLQRWSLDISREPDKHSPSNLNRFKSLFRQSSPIPSPDPTTPSTAESSSSLTKPLSFQPVAKALVPARSSSYTSSSLLKDLSYSNASIKSKNSIDFVRDSYYSVTKTLQKMKSIVTVSLFRRKTLQLPAIPDQFEAI
jgi:hypothetical protein